MHNQRIGQSIQFFVHFPIFWVKVDVQSRLMIDVFIVFDFQQMMMIGRLFGMQYYFQCTSTFSGISISFQNRSGDITIEFTSANKR
jgi:hypothetical protein